MSNGILYVVVGLLLITSLIKDKKKTQKALHNAGKIFRKNINMLLGMMILMGVVFTLINPEFIGRLFGEESGLMGILLGIGIGSATFIPSFIAFPLGAGLLENGAGYPQIAGFISSLMGVGIVSLGMEVEYFGKKVALIRNAFAVIASITFVIVIGVMI